MATPGLGAPEKRAGQVKLDGVAMRIREVSEGYYS